jgi:23S rRNA-/tRNA-specific pseudouridylate synthase
MYGAELESAVTEPARTTVQTLHPHDPPLCLHAWQIRFRHPLSGKVVHFTAPAAGW